MAFMIAAVGVEDYDKWRTNYDRMGNHRREHGLEGKHVYQDAANPNMVTVVIEGELSDLRAYAESKELKEAMAEGGVIGPPQMSFVNEVT